MLKEKMEFIVHVNSMFGLFRMNLENICKKAKFYH